MIRLGDGQDIFLFNALCLSPTNLLRVCLRLSPSLAEFLFIFATVFISQGRLWRKK